MGTARTGLMMLIAVAGLAFSGPALGRPRVDCQERCKAATEDCIPLCQEHAGPKGRGFCKKACTDGEKKCQQKCAKKK